MQASSQSTISTETSTDTKGLNQALDKLRELQDMADDEAGKEQTGSKRSGIAGKTGSKHRVPESNVLSESVGAFSTKIADFKSKTEALAGALDPKKPAAQDFEKIVVKEIKIKGKDSPLLQTIEAGSRPGNSEQPESRIVDFLKVPAEINNGNLREAISEALKDPEKIINLCSMLAIDNSLPPEFLKELKETLGQLKFLVKDIKDHHFLAVEHERDLSRHQIGDPASDRSPQVKREISLIDGPLAKVSNPQIEQLQQELDNNSGLTDEQRALQTNRLVQFKIYASMNQPDYSGPAE